MRIAIDCGGDRGYDPILKGAKVALEERGDLELTLLVGKDVLNQEPVNNTRLKTVVFPYTYNSHHSLKEMLKKRKETSIYSAIQMHKQEEVEAVIAPGDTVGTVIFSANKKEGLGLLDKVYNPALPTHWPRNNVIIDSGACIECRDYHLYQFAIMGKIFSQEYLGVKNPLIGILNVGQEEGKGGKLIRDSKLLINSLKNKGYNILNGFYEPNFVSNFNGGQVVVTGGFVGNTNLKMAEEVISAYSSVLKEEILNQSIWRRWCARKGLEVPKQKIKERFDWKKYSTAPLLGVKGNIMVCHGKSDAEAITNAIRITCKYLECGVNKKLEEELKAHC